jgi:CheY-like chemotaxis protein
MTAQQQHTTLTPAKRCISGDWAHFLPQPTVLIVEDHEDTREMLRILLEMRGCRVVEAENGEAAVGVAERIKPDLILMDAVLPKLDGLSATRRIREIPWLGQVPIIAVTGNVSPEFQLQTIASGCNECIVKPIDFERFDRLLIQHLLKSTSSRSPQPSYSLALRPLHF